MYEQTEDEINNLIQFAISQKKYADVIKLTQTYLTLFGQAQSIYLQRINAFIYLSKYKDALEVVELAQKIEGFTINIGLLKIKCYLQLESVQQAQNTFTKLVDANPDFQKIINFRTAIDIMKDREGRYRISEQEQQILEKMKKWLYPYGAKYDKLKVVNLYDDYRGVIATKSIKKQQTVVFIPKSEIITLELAKKNRFSKQLLKMQVKLLSPKHTFISILLLEERVNPHSQWKPYLDLLPKDHSSFPINFSVPQLELLIGSPFLFMISEKAKDLKKDYETVLKNCRQFQIYSFRDFCWARMMVSSRIFGLVISNIKTEVLVPFADMLNHKTPKQTVWNYVESMNGFTIQSLKDIQIGQQVFDSYGRKCNSRFLLNYGFVIQQNMDNQIALKISITQKDPLSKFKLRMMKIAVNQTHSVIMKISLNMNNNKFYQIMGCLRFITVSDIEQIKILQKISDIARSNQPYKWIRTPPLSIENQIACWTKFVEICKFSLQNYPDTIQQDRKILKKPKITQNVRNIVNLRMGQKYILTEFIEIGTQILAILQNQAMLEILEKQADKIYYKYLCKMLTVMPGINKQLLQKKIGTFGGLNDSNHEEQELDGNQEEQVVQDN